MLLTNWTYYKTAAQEPGSPRAVWAEACAQPGATLEQHAASFRGRPSVWRENPALGPVWQDAEGSIGAGRARSGRRCSRRRARS